MSQKQTGCLLNPKQNKGRSKYKVSHLSKRNLSAQQEAALLWLLSSVLEVTSRWSSTWSSSSAGCQGSPWPAHLLHALTLSYLDHSQSLLTDFSTALHSLPTQQGWPFSFKVLQKLLGVLDVVVTPLWRWCHWRVFVEETFRLHTLNVCHLLYVNYKSKSLTWLRSHHSMVYKPSRSLSVRSSYLEHVVYILWELHFCTGSHLSNNAVASYLGAVPTK